MQAFHLGWYLGLTLELMHFVHLHMWSKGTCE